MSYYCPFKNQKKQLVNSIKATGFLIKNWKVSCHMITKEVGVSHAGLRPLFYPSKVPGVLPNGFGADFLKVLGQEMDIKFHFKLMPGYRPVIQFLT